MRFTRAKAFLVLGLAVAVFGGFWLYENFEMQEIRYPASLEGAAVRNDLLAAERFTGALGAHVESGFGFHRPPGGTPSGSVLVLPTTRRTMTPRQREELMRWIEAGGHLVAVTYTLEGEAAREDALLSALGVRQFHTEEGRKYAPREEAQEDEAEDEESAQRARDRRRERERRDLERKSVLRNLLAPSRNCETVSESGVRAPRFPVPGSALSVCFHPWYRLESRDPPLWRVASSHGVHALAVARGKGMVTVLADYEFMTNREIAKADHAVMLAAILGFAGEGAKPRQVMFVPREDMADIFSLTWRYAWPVVVALLVWLALALWRHGTRFGPLAPTRTLARRSLAEHVRASGEFLWRHGEAMHLWRATLASTRRRLDRSVPASMHADHEHYLRALEQRSGVEAKHIGQALDSNHAPPPEKFPTIIATLEILRKKL